MRPFRHSLCGAFPAPPAPGNLLWTPDYSVASSPIDPATLNVLSDAQTNIGMVAGHTWHSYEPPIPRGTRATSRVNLLTGSNVPGSGGDPYRPAGCLEVSLNPIPGAGDFNVTAVAGSAVTPTVDSNIYLSPSDAALLQFGGTYGDYLTSPAGEHMYVNGTPDTVGGVVPVHRGLATTPAAINPGDVLAVSTGDVNPSGNDWRNRCEVYDRFPAGGSGVNPSKWPDPIGSIRWYRFKYFLPGSATPGNLLPLTTGSWNGTNPWWDCSQIKGLNGGSPPDAIGISIPGDGTASWHIDHDGAPRYQLGPVTFDAWTQIDIGVLLGTTKATSWTVAYLNGVQKLVQTSGATMDLYRNAVDPVYLKQGIYRTTAWRVSHTIYIGPPQVAAAYADLA